MKDLIQYAELLTVHLKDVNLEYLVPEGGSRPHGYDESLQHNKMGT